MNQTHADKIASYATALLALKTMTGCATSSPRAGIDFASNDYLALASAPRMKMAVAAALEAGTPIGANRGFCAETARSTKVSKQKRLSSLGRRRRFFLAAVMSQILLS